MDNLVGTTIGGFNLKQAMASGPTGQIFRAEDADTAPLAVKVIHSALNLYTKVDPYWNELQQIRRLSHPHITSATSADWSKAGRFFLALPLLEGADLHAVLSAHGKLPMPQVLLFAGQVCLALEAAHEQGIVHGAVKPYNIFLVPKNSPSAFSTRLMDFGTAHLFTAPSPDAALPPGSPGMPQAAYLAPEQFEGICTKASDVYSLGVVLHEAMTGRRPFVGAYKELAQQHQTAPLELPDTLPDALSALLTRALAKDPAERFSSISEVREALEAWASTAPEELEAAPLELFPKKTPGAGVNDDGPEGDQTDRVIFEELNQTIEHDDQIDDIDPVLDTAKATEEPQKVATHKSKQSKEPKKKNAGEIPEDPELAAIAEQATNQLRAESVQAEETPEPPPQEPEPETMMMDDGEMVELPLERSVLAYVADLSLDGTLPSQDHGSNGESLDDALDLFVNEAKTLGAALPPPIVDDRELANLAQAPVPEPDPEPEPEPDPPPAAHVAPLDTPPPPEKSSAMPVIIAFVLGGVLMFGGYKLFGPKPVPAPTPAEPTQTVAAPAADQQQVAPASEALTTDETKPATTAEGHAGTAGATSPTAVDAGPSVATASPDGAPASSAEAGASVASTADAAPAAAPAPAAAAVASKSEKPAVKKSVRKRRRRTPRKKAKAARTKRTKRAKPASKKAKKSSDWVDPFSQ